VIDKDKGTIAMSIRTLKSLLTRAANGEDPDLIIIEEVANAHQGSLVEWATELERRQGLR
jgi:hypothetical protein